MKHYGDITKINGAEVEPVWVVIGGSPCQDLSVAGRRAGLQGERSGLFMEQIRIIKEMREADERRGRTDEHIRPRYMVWENVPGALSSNGGEDFRVVLEETARVKDKTAVIPRPPKGKWSNSGCIVGDGWSIAWRIRDAQFWGVPQRRRRIALVADFGGLTAPEILFERESVSGYYPQGRTPWERATRTAESRFGTAGTGRITAKTLEIRGGCEGGGKGTLIQDDKSATLACNNDQVLFQPTYCIQGNCIDRADTAGCNGRGWTEGVSYTLNTVDRPAVAADVKGRLVLSEDSSAVYDARGNGDGKIAPTMTGDHQNRVTDYTAVAVTPCAWDGSQVSPTLTANNAGGNQRMPDKGNFNSVIDIDHSTPKECAFHGQASESADISAPESSAPTLMRSRQVDVLDKMIVRRLTPLECERLQGFPDGWTDIGDYEKTDKYGRKLKGKPITDSARYKALGNSIATVAWLDILAKIADRCEEKTMASLFDGIGGFPLIWERICGGKAIWASEIEEFPIAVTKKHFPEMEG